MREFDLLEKYFWPLMSNQKGESAAINDAAVCNFPPSHQLVITTDTCVCGIHFLPSDPPGKIAQKTLRMNLSDLNAVGAKPTGYTLSIQIPKNSFVNEEWISRFVDGLREDQEKYDIPLLGGDTVSSPKDLAIAITAIGSVRDGMYLTRDSAQPGDRIYVSGTIGDAALGLEVALEKHDDMPESQKTYFLDAYRLPSPPCDLAQSLGEFAHATIDISDGFLADLKHICKASKQVAYVKIEDIPLSENFHRMMKKAKATEKERLLTLALTGGDDFQLIFTAAPGDADHVQYLSQRYDVPITLIGHVAPPVKDLHTDDTWVNLVDTRGTTKVIDNQSGFEHQWKSNHPAKKVA
jgi:thiamine-monophosphate kinase